MGKIKVIVIAGPTASGKSDLAISLARTFNGEIISADSRQVYRGMDIGTGKVTKREQKIARHWLIDVASPRQQYSVARWRRAAQKTVRDIARRGKMPIICGGTGFWIDALIYDAVLPEVKPNPKLRAQLEAETTERLYANLLHHDPVRAQSIDRHNRRRLVRALEIIHTTKEPVPVLAFRSPYDFLYLGIHLSKEQIIDRIIRRLDKRLKAGMIAEAKLLHEQGLSWKKMESFGLEYRWLAHYLRDRITKSQMREGLLRDIIRYYKRQLTWWRKNPDIIWITGSAHAARLAKKFISA